MFVVFEIRDANFHDIDQIAEIHLSAIPYSINAIMGATRLKDLYTLALNDQNSQLLVAEKNGEVVGFISGTSDFSNFAKSGSRSISIKQIGQLIRKSNPWMLLIAIIDLVQVSRAFGKLGEVYYFSTWSMVPGSSPAEGSALFRELTKRAQNTGTPSVLVNVRKNNIKVLRMYKTLGFFPVLNTISEIVLKKDF